MSATEHLSSKYPALEGAGHFARVQKRILADVEHGAKSTSPRR
ncbi:MAG: hypothetical protein ACMG6S_34140 [Byssovorax sp.]